MRRMAMALFVLGCALTARGASAAPISLAQGARVYFTASEDRRQLDFDVELGNAVPSGAQVQLRLRLRCPSGGCDAWDRNGTFGMFQPTADGQTAYLELMRFMTPYGIGAEWVTDVTDFASFLRGSVRFRVFIDTWVGPGHAQGAGWVVDAALEVLPSTPAQRVVAIVPVIQKTELVYGDPSSPASISRTLPALRPGQRAKLKMIITGHGQGNAENCAEFCPKTHSVTIGQQTYARQIWRDDCERTVDSNQHGNWWSPRAGWCPGDQVHAWEEDVTSAFVGGGPSFRYAAEPYENTCRPDSSECGGCVFGTSCAYDGGLHTEPYYSVTGYIVVYE